MSNEKSVKNVSKNVIKLSVNYVKYVEYLVELKKVNNLVDDKNKYENIVSKKFSNKKRVFSRMNNFVNSVSNDVIKSNFNLNKSDILKLCVDYKKKNKSDLMYMSVC